MKCPQCQAENLPDSRFCGKCATPLPQEPTQVITPQIIDLTDTLQAYVRDLPRGSLFAGRYEVIEELGRGGMGRVYRAFDRKLGEPVALKLLNPEISFNPKAVERFRNELRFARKISHRNVVRLFDLGEEGLTHFITMEYVEGENLKRFIKRSGHLTPAKSVSLGLQVTEGLAEAHRLGAIHRDLKPQNIMIDPEGNARILDFGIARFLDSETVTGSGIMIGTPEYMSPEQIDLKDVDARTDIYSLGVILFEMLTGRVPFEAETPIGVALMHKTLPPASPRELNPDVGQELAAVVLRCLEKDRERRYASARDLATDLGLVLQGLPATEVQPARSATTPRQITVTLHPKKFVRVALVVGALAAAALLGRFVIFRPSASPLQAPQALSGHEHGAPRGILVEKGANEARPPLGPSGPSPNTTGLLGWLGEQAKKYVAPEELQSIKDPGVFLQKIKTSLPKDSDLGPWVDKAIKKMDEGHRYEEQGRTDLAQKSQAEGQLQMKELLSLVADRQAVGSVKDDMTQAKNWAKGSGAGDKNLLFLMAQNAESGAEDALRKNDFSGAKTLYRVLERVYRLSAGCKDDGSCLKSLQAYVAAQASDVGALDPERVDRWSLNFAAGIVKQAKSFLDLKQPENAAASLIQAAFLYQRIKEEAAGPRG